MLKKEQLEKLLERCMASSCDFAEIFEEEGTTESSSYQGKSCQGFIRIESCLDATCQ